MMIASVISVACARHLGVWSVVAPRVSSLIPAHSYCVIVPDEEIELFRSASPETYRIMGENEVLPGVKEQIILKLSGSPAQSRVGWYFQQFLKIEACRSSLGERMIIWDADTIPLRALSFFDSEGCPVFYKGHEHHPPYFDALEKLTGLRKQVEFSFIAQSLPLKKEWIEDFIAGVESHTGKPWVDAILDAIDTREASGFSEYEAMGNFFASKYRDQLRVRASHWYRNGNALLGKAECVDQKALDRLSALYDFVSFESWDVKRIKWKKRLLLWLALRSGVALVFRSFSDPPRRL